jgi:hypothetical protein
VLAALAPRWRLPFFALAALIAFSRLYNGVHYPTDVLAGSVLGVLVGLAVVRVSKRGRRLQPTAGIEQYPLQLFCCAQQAAGDHAERRNERDPDADPAAVGRKDGVGDRDHADQDENRCQGTEAEDEEAFRD